LANIAGDGVIKEIRVVLEEASRIIHSLDGKETSESASSSVLSEVSIQNIIVSSCNHFAGQEQT